jgi:hypothetical protein
MGGLVVGGDRQSLLLPLLAPAPASETLLKPAAHTNFQLSLTTGSL